MVKAELEYNPYLLETKIKFNGQKQTINSLVEKYEKGALRDWVDRIPKIFYDEMNGYNFELEFSGTKRDFCELQLAFESNGVSEKMVHLFHKNVLEGRSEKTQKIEELLEWLEENRNRHFDYDEFKQDNRDLFEGLYSFIVINGRNLDLSVFDNTDVSVELIDELDELEHTSLEDTPILINVTNTNYGKLANIITTLFHRDDVKTNQIFFAVESSLNTRMVERTIIDIGIDNPQMINGINDEKVMRYMELYPYSDYIHDALCVLREKVNSMIELLNEENRISAAANREIYEKIERLDGIISRLKRAHERFENDYNAEIPQMWMIDEDVFLKFVQDWRIKKTKINKPEEAEKFALDFEAEIKEAYSKYLSSIDGLHDRNIEELNKEYEEWYAEAEYNDGFKPELDAIEKPDIEPIPSFSEDLLEMKDEKYVVAKEGLVEKFFKQTNDDTKDLVLETTYYLQNWRDKVFETVEPLAHAVLTDYFDVICNYERQVIESYVEHLSKEITKNKKERNAVSRQLSDEEKQLQKDNDWLRNFEDILRNIERC